MYYIKTMETYCASCKKNTSNKIYSLRRTKQINSFLYKIMLFVVIKNSSFIKTQENSRLELQQVVF